MSQHIGPRTISATGGSIKRVGNYRVHTFPSELVTDGLVLNLDAADPRSYPGSGTTWTDLSGNGNTGTLTNGPTYSNADGGSMVFDGVDDYIVSTTSNGLGNVNSSPSISLEMWVKLSRKSGGGQQFQYVSGYRNSNFSFYLLLLDSSDATVPTEARIITSSGTYDINVNFAPYFDVWTHVVFTANTNRSNLYFNGSLVGSNTSVSGTFGSSTGNFVMGVNPPDPTFFALKGNVSASRVYNRALSPAEVAQNYDALKVRYTSYTNTFTPLCGGGSGKVEVLCVAGGGGGGSDHGGGGGGAGGLIYNSAFTINSNIGIGVTIGAGGTAQLNGANSSFSSLISIGGGRGGGESSPQNGQTGGSGGGGSGYASATTGGSGTTGQGFIGGRGAYPDTGVLYGHGGGGGGAGGAGGDGTEGNGATAGTAGNGGNGLSYSISGTSQFYAGGGGGGFWGTINAGGLGGSGIGGRGGENSGANVRPATNGIPNTGSGGGGSSGLFDANNQRIGGNGSNGTVIVRYPATDYNVELLVVGGGGAGGGSADSMGGGGGGGAGGLLYYSSYPVSAGTKYTVNVGLGGIGVVGVGGVSGGNGTNSSFGTLIGYGGGGGGSGSGTGSGNNGGSGGGGGYRGYNTVANGGFGVAGQGNNGSGVAASSAGGGGGGGAGSAGLPNDGSYGVAVGGPGGSGLTYAITGSSVTYAAGGQGGSSAIGIGTANTGNGGGAVYGTSTTPGFNGGSGIVIIAYKGPQRGIGGVVDTTSRPGYTLHKFTTTGTDLFIP